MKPNAKYGVAMPSVGAAIAFIMVWAWNEFVPEHQMPADMAAVLGAVVSPLIGRFLPASERGA